MIDLSKIKRHKEYTRIFIPRTVIPSVLITLQMNHDKDHRFYRYPKIPKGIKVPQVRLDPTNQLMDPKPGMLISHYDPDEFTALLWDMDDDEDVITYQEKRNQQSAENFKAYREDAYDHTKKKGTENL